MLTRHPDGIDGKSFYQKDAPGFAPPWLRTEKIYSHDSQRDISYFILDSADALAYMANLAAITIHIWSSRLPHLENPDWLLFDIDPKGSTTHNAVLVANQTAMALRELGLRPYLKTSGQAGLHVVVGLEPKYTYEQARMFSELVARLVVSRIPDLATINRNPGSRRAKCTSTISNWDTAKPSPRPSPCGPSRGPGLAPLDWKELKPNLDPGEFQYQDDAPADGEAAARPVYRSAARSDDAGGRAARAGRGNAFSAPAQGRLTMSHHNHRAALIVAGLFIVMAVTIASSFDTLGVFLLPLSKQFGWSRTQVSLIATALQLSSAAAMPLVGLIIDRVDAKRVMLCGVIALGFALLAASRANSLPQMLAAYAVIGLASAASSIVPGALIISRCSMRAGAPRWVSYSRVSRSARCLVT